MSLDRDRDELEEFIDEEESRSIFAATWFRALLGMITLGVIIAVFLPYLLEWGTATTERKVEAPAPSTTKEPAPSASEGSGAPGPGIVASPPPTLPPVGDAVASLEPKSTEPGKAAAPLVPDVQSPKNVQPPKSVPPRSSAKEPSAKAPVKREQSRATVEVRRASSKPTASGTAGTYWVQVGTFKDPEAARRLAARLREQKLPASNRPVTISEARERGAQLSRVRVGPFPDRATAASKLRELQARGYKPFIAQDRA